MCARVHRRRLQQVLEADVVLVSTPIYKAAYGGLKTFLDLLPQDARCRISACCLWPPAAVLACLALDCALRPVLNALGARQMPTAHLPPTRSWREREAVLCPTRVAGPPGRCGGGAAR